MIDYPSKFISEMVHKCSDRSNNLMCWSISCTEQQSESTVIHNLKNIQYMRRKQHACWSFHLIYPLNYMCFNPCESGNCVVSSDITFCFFLASLFPAFEANPFTIFTMLDIILTFTWPLRGGNLAFSFFKSSTFPMLLAIVSELEAFQEEKGRHLKNKETTELMI